MNALLGTDRAIVNDAAGTTRDSIEEGFSVDGWPVRLTDTAGIQTTDDTIEQLGIERSRQAIRRAQIVIELLDSTDPQPVIADGELTAKQIRLRVYNKVDLLSQTARKQLPADADTISISAKSKEIVPLLDLLREHISRLTAHSDSVLISNMRHYEALCRAGEALQGVQQGLEAGLSGELLTPDLHDALDALGEITGQVSSQEVLNTIFERFCIGK